MDVRDVNKLLEGKARELTEMTKGEIYPKVAVSVDKDGATMWTAVGIGGHMEVGDSVRRLQNAAKLISKEGFKAIKGYGGVPYSTNVVNSYKMPHLMLVMMRVSSSYSGGEQMAIRRQAQKAGLVLKDMRDYN
jgi:hypothetical protein